LQAMVESGEIYHPLRWTPADAYQFLLAVPQFEAAKKITVEKKTAQVKKSASTRKSTGGKIEVAVVTAKVKSVLPKPKPVSEKKK